jgi:hypothetical protein
MGASVVPACSFRHVSSVLQPWFSVLRIQIITLDNMILRFAMKQPGLTKVAGIFSDRMYFSTSALVSKW